MALNFSKQAIRFIFVIAVSFIPLFSMIFQNQAAIATPTIALKESNNCQGCHTPGRPQRPVLERRCTLDCQGCHIDPNGAGPRNQWGYYYSQDQMAIINFIKPIDPLKDMSRYDAHYDGRTLTRQTADESRNFPMSSEISLRLRPFVKWIHLTYQRLYLGRIDDKIFRESNEQRIFDRYSIMADELPMNMYVRAARGTPVYGLRQPNHSLWIRERIGLNQFATQDSITVGGTPNVPFLHFSMLLGEPNAREEDKQKGYSFHGGLRGVTLGWHINTSYWKTQSKKTSINMNAIGFGGNIYNFIIYGERNWRNVEELPLKVADIINLESNATRIHPTSTISDYSIVYAGLQGITAGIKQEELQDPTSNSSRLNYYIESHPIPYLQFEIWRRFETGNRSLADTLVVAHFFVDF